MEEVALKRRNPPRSTGSTKRKIIPPNPSFRGFPSLPTSEKGGGKVRRRIRSFTWQDEKERGTSPIFEGFLSGKAGGEGEGVSLRLGTPASFDHVSLGFHGEVDGLPCARDLLHST